MIRSIFYLSLKQAQSAVTIALPRLKGFGILTKRPEDYFAEMSKTDNHMKKVRATLLSKHAEIEKRDKIRKLRELKKMGKSIQIENEQKKAKEKKKKYKSEADFKQAVGEKADKKDKKVSVKDKKFGKSSKTKFKDQKYGFGGRKKRSKYNTADSSADAFKSNRAATKKSAAAVGGHKGKQSFKKSANKNKPKGSKQYKKK